MSANRTQFFYQEVTLAAAYETANIFQFPASLENLKIKVSGGGGDNCEFSLVGAEATDLDGKLLASETETFNNLSLDRIALRGQGTARVWGWK